jgi:hypothetical protein
VVEAPVGTRVTLLDSNLHPVRTSVGRFEGEVGAGIYKVVATQGEGSYEQLVEVQGGEASSASVSVPSAQLSSAAPGPWNRLSHEYHSDLARDLSRQPQVVRGSGSQIFVFVRSFSTVASRRHWSADDLGRGLALLDLSGSLLVDLHKMMFVNDGVPDPCGGLTVEVDPGAYRLRMTTKAAGNVELCIIACPSWQTQVFTLLTDWDRSDDDEWGADLVNATLSMSRQGFATDPWMNQGLSLIDVARSALASNQPAISSADLHKLLNDKFANPMLGILGAHALFAQDRRRSRDAVEGELLPTVIGNLRSLLGSHPDVDALRCAMGERLDVPSIPDAPPMLTRSWSILAEVATRNSAFMPDGSLCARIGHRLWGPSTWLLWQEDVDFVDEEAYLEAAGSEAELLQRVQDRIRSIDSAERLQDATSSADATDFESLVAQTLYLKERRPMKAGSSSSSAGEGSPSVEALARSVRVPPSTMRIALKGLSKKLS